MKKYSILTLFTVLLLSEIHSQSITKKELQGSYSLKRIDYIYKDTTIQVNPSQNGFLIISPLRYAIAYNPGLNPRVAFSDISQPTDEETLAGFRSFAFNSGSYQVNNNEFIATPDFAKVPGFEGGEQIYRLKKEGDFLSFTMHDETYPSGEKPAWYEKLEIKLYFEKEETP